MSLYNISENAVVIGKYTRDYQWTTVHRNKDWDAYVHLDVCPCETFIKSDIVQVDNCETDVVVRVRVGDQNVVYKCTARTNSQGKETLLHNLYVGRHEHVQVSCEVASSIVITGTVSDVPF